LQTSEKLGTSLGTALVFFYSQICAWNSTCIFLFPNLCIDILFFSSKQNQQIQIRADIEFFVPKTWHFSVHVDDYSLPVQYKLFSGTYTQKSGWKSPYIRRQSPFYIQFHRNLDGKLEAQICSLSVQDITGTNEKVLYSYVKTHDQDNMLGVYRRRDANNSKLGQITVEKIHSIFTMYDPDQNKTVPVSDFLHPVPRAHFLDGKLNHAFLKADFCDYQNDNQDTDHANMNLGSFLLHTNKWTSLRTSLGERWA